MVWGTDPRIQCSMLFNDVPDDKLYRVQIHNDTNTIEVVCIGIDRVDSDTYGMYASADDLPKWLQERLAILMVTSWSPPTVGVDGIGKRIDKDTFWVVHP